MAMDRRHDITDGSIPPVNRNAVHLAGGQLRDMGIQTGTISGFDEILTQMAAGCPGVQAPILHIPPAARVVNKRKTSGH